MIGGLVKQRNLDWGLWCANVDFCGWSLMWPSGKCGGGLSEDVFSFSLLALYT